MQSVLKRGLFRTGVSCGCALAMSWLCLAVMTASAGAEPAFSRGAPEAKPTPKVKPTPKAKPAPGGDSVPKAKSAPAAKADGKANPKSRASGSQRPTRSKRRASPKLQKDPNAKWVCAQPTVDLGQVWRGKRALTFSFDIHNEGTADLRIKARGG